MKSKKTILHLIHSGGFYGAEAVILNLSIGLKESGIRPIICCFWNKGAKKPELVEIAEQKGMDVEYIHFKRKTELVDPIKQIKKIIRDQKVDILHSHGYKPSFFCFLLYLLFGIPYVVTCHLWFVGSYRMRLYILLERFSMLFAKKIIAVSHPIATSIGSWWILKKKVKVINNGINIDKYADYSANFNAKKLRADLGVSPNTRLIGSLGRLTRQKAHQILIEAAHMLLKDRSDIEFLVGGEGPMFQFLTDLCVTYGISNKFHFIGFRSDPISILKLLDAFVLCSIDEGLPIVLLEAMSVGVPVITTDVGEIPVVLQNNYNGIMIKKGDSKLLSESIKRLLDDDAFCNKIASNAKATVNSRFSISKMSSEYINVYNALW